MVAETEFLYRGPRTLSTGEWATPLRVLAHPDRGGPPQRKMIGGGSSDWSGIGTSIGVKGLRVGTGPKGSYLHGGRGGLYFRERLGEPASELPAPEESQAADAAPPKDGLMRLIRRLFAGRQ